MYMHGTWTAVGWWKPEAARASQMPGLRPRPAKVVPAGAKRDSAAGEEPASEVLAAEIGPAWFVPDLASL